MASIEQSSDDLKVRGAASLLLATLMFAITDAAAKWLGGEGYHASQIVFFRYLFGLIPMGIAIWIAGGVSLRTEKPLAHLVRAVLMCLTLLLFFWGLRYVKLGDAIAVAFTAPLFITALSMPILGERVGRHRWAAVAVGFLGMLVILRPGFGSFQMEMLLIVASAFLFAFAVLFTRRLTSTETNTSIFTYTTIISGLVMTPFAVVTWVPPSEFSLLIFLSIGLIGGTAHFLVIVAYRHLQAAVNATLEYAALIWAIILGYVLWNEVPDRWVLIGAGIVVTAGIYITHRETRAGIKARSARANSI